MTTSTPDTNMQSESGLAKIRQQRIDKITQWQELGINPFPYKFEKSHSNQQLQTQYQDLDNGVETEDTVQVAGRIMALRNSGMFIDLQDDSGKLQLFCHKDNLSPEILAQVKMLDIGDIIGASGIIRRTPRGELSVKVKAFTLLSKSLLPLPEKYHGLTDVEIRYRQRYLDLIVNEDTRKTLRLRSQIITNIRQLLVNKGFLEVETPMLHPIAGGASAKPFVTHHNTLDQDMYLRIAPELYLKRLVVGGLSEKVFEMNRNFRNEGISPRHNPEFTMMELYQAYADYGDMMDLVEQIFAETAQAVLGSMKVTYGEHEIDLTPPWPRKTMSEMVKEKTGLDFDAITDAAVACEEAKKIGVNVQEKDSWGSILEQVFEEKIEDSLIQPIHITDYPREISPLAKEHRDNPRLVERFETRINGWEVSNAFSELSDPLDQKQRFEAQLKNKAAGDEEAHDMDEDYITALEYGMPPCGGLGVGIDRLVMILTNSANIRDVIAFPTLKKK